MRRVRLLPHAGGVLLTFTPREYTDFTERVGDCYWEQALRDLPATQDW